MIGGGLADVGLVGVCGVFGSEVGCLVVEVVCFSAEVKVGLGTEFEVCFIMEGDGDALDIVDALQSE